MGLGNDHDRQARQFLASTMGQDTEEPPGAWHQVEGVGDPSPLRAQAAFHQGQQPFYWGLRSTLSLWRIHSLKEKRVAL